MAPNLVSIRQTMLGLMSFTSVLTLSRCALALRPRRFQETTVMLSIEMYNLVQAHRTA